MLLDALPTENRDMFKSLKGLLGILGEISDQLDVINVGVSENWRLATHYFKRKKYDSPVDSGALCSDNPTLRLGLRNGRPLSRRPDEFQL